ncbi:hypothetical protein SCB71_20345 [Herbiconiux sp. KACC 21604]|uniref:hypothetical protein n=1 Tax=unclassified Herbiconiux TaxID=2618217 RepID=UPI0020A517C0|nr:hypothetical protein [Herbiconiux sp. SALV-R1]WPO86546.1 hypothetical protein SCB71_20345 [Herbiconiux sp. KACC 21604]
MTEHETHAEATESAASRATNRARVTGVIVVGMSVAVWWPAFTLGAWGDFFFDQMLTVWAASTGALFVVLLQLRGRARILRALALLIPSLWLALSFVPVPNDEDVFAWAVTLLGILVGLLAVPTTIWVLARIIWPEFGDEISWPRRLVVIGAVALIALASFLLGVNQSKFLTCEEFTISGNSQPPGCTPESELE